MQASWPESGDFSLIVLSGGGSRRLGRDKASVHVGGQPLIARLLGQVPAATSVVLVGPTTPDLPDRVRVTREDPPGSGPLAGLAAGLALVRTGFVGVLAVDMPFALPVLADAMGRLGTAPPGVDVVLPIDSQGRVQPLCAAYRVRELWAALAGLGVLADRPVRALLPRLRALQLPVGTPDLVDVDTTAELAQARARAALEGAPMQHWVAAVQDTLGLDESVEIDVILDVARDAAHAVGRPAAPVTTFLLGMAVARGANPTLAAADIERLAQDWTSADH